MGHYSIISIDHDSIHEDAKDRNLGEKLHNLVMVGPEDPYGQLRFYEKPVSATSLYTSHADVCPVLAISHGNLKGVLGSLTIPRHDDKTLDDYLIEIAKQRGFVIYKKGEK